MISSFVRALVSAFQARRELALENVALRQQLAVLRRSVKRPRLSNVDREFWVLLRIVPSINSSCMRLANFLQPGCFGRLHVGRFKSRRRLYSGQRI